MTRHRDRAAESEPHARHTRGEAEDEAPPFFGSWRVLYAIVVVELLGVIMLCHWITLRNA